MKHVLYYGFKFLTVATIILLGSCTTGDTPYPSTIADSQNVAISLQMGINNVSSRELTSFDDAQQVNDMRIYLFRCPQAEGKEGTYTYYIPQDLENQNKGYYTVGSFNNQTPYKSEEHNGKFETHLFDFTPILGSGYYYKILAIGRDDKYSNTPKLNQPSFTANTTTFDEASLSLSSSTTQEAQQGKILLATEFFTGKLQENDKETGADDAILVTDDSKEFSRAITLKRAVAGLMFYVQNIPSLVEDNTSNTATTFTPTTLTLEASAMGTEEYLAGRTAANTPLNYQIIASIDLSADNGWTNDETNHIFTRPADTDKEWKENSYMATNYMMPTLETSMSIGKNASSQAENQKVTFYFHYTDGIHHRYDNVKLITNDGSRLVFPIEVNHLYAIGEKSKNNNEPYDLKKHYQPVMTDMTLEIEPAFDKRHDFDIN